MIASLDSSVLIAALVESENHHEECDVLLDLPDINALGHAFVETFTYLTGGRLLPRMQGDEVVELFSISLLPTVSPIILTFEETLAAMKDARSRGIRGGAIYDYLHLAAARKIHAERLYTLNVSDFRAFWRVGDPEIVHPAMK